MRSAPRARKKEARRRLIGCCALLIHATCHAGPALLPAPEGFHAPTATLRIEAGALAGAGEMHRAVELDDIDVTALLEVDNSVLVLRPPQPLAPGWHTLRLVEFSDDGEIIERGFWRFEVRRSALWRERRGSLEASLSAALPVAENEGLDSRFEHEGTARLEGRADSGTWRLSGNAELAYQPRDELRPGTMAPLDAATFGATAERGAWRLHAGHQAPLPPSLVADGEFLRRGIAAAHQGRTSRAGAFVIRSQEAAGLGEGLGIAEAEDRLGGFTFEARPHDDLRLSATWLAGRDPGPIGDGVAADPELAAAGRALGVAADGLLWQRRLRLRGEWAQSLYDYDGNGPLTEERAHAHTLLIHYTPARPLTLGGEPLAWQAGLEQRRLGTFFRSLANPGAGADREGWRAFLSAAWGGFDLQAGAAKERDNVDDLPDLPRLAFDQTWLTLGWQPMQWQPPAWLGQPALSLELQRDDQQVERGDAFLAVGGLRATENATLGATFGYERGSWNLQLGHGRDHDLALDERSRSRSAELSASLQPTAPLSLDLSYQRERYDDGAGTSTTDVATLDLYWALGERLTLQLTQALERQGGTETNRTANTSATLAWRWREASGGRPGVTLTLEGMRDANRYGDEPETRLHQLFLRLEIGWQAGMQ